MTDHVNCADMKAKFALYCFLISAEDIRCHLGGCRRIIRVHGQILFVILIARPASPHMLRVSQSAYIG